MQLIPGCIDSLEYQIGVAYDALGRAVLTRGCNDALFARKVYRALTERATDILGYGTIPDRAGVPLEFERYVLTFVVGLAIADGLCITTRNSGDGAVRSGTQPLDRDKKLQLDVIVSDRTFSYEDVRSRVLSHAEEGHYDALVGTLTAITQRYPVPAAAHPPKS